MATQGALYDILEQETPAIEEVAYLCALGIKKSCIRSTLQVRHRTAEGFEQFEDALLEATGCDAINWEHGSARLVTPENESQSIRSFEVEGIDQTLDEVLLTAYDDLYKKQKSEELADALSPGAVSRPARIIATLARRRYHNTRTSSLDKSFLWDSFGLVENETFERDARLDILNELVRVGCIVKDGADIYVRPALAALSQPDEYLPVVGVLEE